MELNVKEQTEKLEMEMAELTNQLGMMNQQVSLWTQRRNAIQVLIDKKQGALELLQSLNGDKPAKD